ncbi:TetR/AcrR family transcriptional regulator [Thermomonospora umbrina]|uniref:TetR family transcriptional regulator n=1 Tax=Thermomonospora umbrina TaxID=111806 RepID=A0A3D9SM10_9ACTN|nr:TetR/AcrR family transcriptional regulator [Thermomonospora umbrina]REE94953.1 TetR family transcriptional regulator [Thermomonospora umbrina]
MPAEKGTGSFTKPPEGPPSGGPGTRRRGGALESAIFDAVFEEIHAVGYGRLTMEGVATAAQTGKAALYRRWNSKDELIRDALLHALPDPAALPFHDSVREDLMELLLCLRTTVEVTKGATFQILKAETMKDGRGLLHAVVRERVTDPLKDLIEQALRRGAERGEVRPEAATRLVATVGPAMVTAYCLTDGTDVPDEYLRAVVDEVLMPLLRP